MKSPLILYLLLPSNVLPICTLKHGNLYFAACVYSRRWFTKKNLISCTFPNFVLWYSIILLTANTQKGVCWPFQVLILVTTSQGNQNQSELWVPERVHQVSRPGRTNKPFFGPLQLKDEAMIHLILSSLGQKGTKFGHFGIFNVNLRSICILTTRI